MKTLPSIRPDEVSLLLSVPCRKENRMQVQQEDDQKRGAFFVEENGERLAEMTYVWAGAGLFIIDHTEVSDKLAGKGAGKQLVHRAVEFARERNVQIKPLCSFALSVFEKVPDYADVWKH